MNLETSIEIFLLISQGTNNLASQKNSILLRKSALNEYLTGFKKVAFDTRRIDQETEYNPRRGLQNYNRSEAFISDITEDKIKNLAKLRNTLEDLKEIYGKEHEWQDSNARILLSTLDNGLRIKQGDGDFSSSQPSMSSLNYIEQLLYMRYRLTFDDIKKTAQEDLKKVILAKDEELTKKDMKHSLVITKSDVANQSYDSLIEKLFGGIKASENAKNVERTVTITIKDSILD